MIILILTYKKSIEEVEKHLTEHNAFLDKYYALGQFMCSGPKNPRTGGVILAQQLTKAELLEIIKEDPFVEHDIVDFEIVEFIPTKYDHRLETLVVK
ncbi:MAG TPA: YciI family protein [Cytophagales bacterium]|nr:YciI family protein [Cytophagales bacterium]